MKKQLIWVFEWRKSVHYWWSYISFAPECKELTCMLDPLLYRWSVPPVVIRCVHWTMQRGVLQTWINIHSPAIVMGSRISVDDQFLIFKIRTLTWPSGYLGSDLPQNRHCGFTGTRIPTQCNNPCLSRFKVTAATQNRMVTRHLTVSRC